MYSGVVRNVISRPYGTKTLHSFQLDSDRTYYNLGEKAPTFESGVTIKFTGKPGTRAGTVSVDANSVEVVNESPVKTEDYSMKSAGARRTDFVDKDQYWKNREAKDEVTQKRIEIQAARNAAIALLACERQVGRVSDAEMISFINDWTNHFLADNEQRLGN